MLVGGTVAVSAIVGLAIAATPSAPVYAGLFLLVAMLFVAMIARSPMARRRRRVDSARFASILFGILLALVAFYNVTFERSYKDDAGKWQSTAAFSLNDLLLLAKVADRAHSEIYKLRANDRQSEKFDE